MLAASTPPVNLLGVILCATFVTRPIPWLAWAVPILARSLVFQMFPAGQQVKAIIGGYSHELLREMFSEVHAIVRPGIIAFRVRELFQVDVREQLRVLDLPLLYIAAAKDRVVPAGNLRLIQQIKPGIKVVTIKGPHGIPQTRPAETVAAISDFIASLESETVGNIP